MKKNKKKIIFSIILIVLITIMYVTKEFQNDTFYLIKVGEAITKYGVDFKDHFSFHNLPYLYPHFLFSVIVYFAYKMLSFDGIYLLSILLSINLSLVMYFVNIKSSKNKIIPLITTILFLIYMVDFLTLRSQIVSYPIFILEYYFLNKLISSNKNKYIIYIFLLNILLVNTHVAVYPFSIILILPFLGEYIYNKIFKKENFKINKILIVILLISISGFISPLGVNSYTYLYNTLINNTTSVILEHQPPVLYKDFRMIVIILFTLFLLLNKKVKIDIRDKFLLLGLFYMALTSIRHQSLYYIFLFIVLNKGIENVIPKNIIKDIENMIFSVKGGVISLIFVLILGLPFIYKNSKTSYINKKIYPVDAVSYIKNNIDYKNKHIFNCYDYGSYLILNDIKVFIDSRSDLYTKSYNKKRDIFDDYINVMDFKIDYEYVFDLYDIDYVLLPSNCNLKLYLSMGNKTHDYIYKYSDSYFTLLERKARVNK